MDNILKWALGALAVTVLLALAALLILAFADVCRLERQYRRVRRELSRELGRTPAGGEMAHHLFGGKEPQRK
jgi:hypothetical protein